MTRKRVALALLVVGVAVGASLVAARHSVLPGLAPERLDGLVVGSLAFADAEDRLLRLDQAGKLYLVDFIALGCKPCMDELPDVVDLDREFGGSNRFQIVLVLHAWRGSALREHAEELKIGAIPLYADVDKAAERLGVSGWPTKFLIRDGRVLYRKVGSGRGDHQGWRRVIRQELENPDRRTTRVALAGTASKAGDEREVAGIELRWCPPGRFRMGSPPDEPERRPGEDQVEVTLTKGFWMGKFEVTQGQWKRVVGELPGALTAELPAGEDFPVGNVAFAEAEAFCRRLTELGHRSGDLPKDLEFRLPTEAQWEYACRAGTTTATAFGDRLSSKQANFKGKPYNGAEPGPSLDRATKVGSYPANAWGLHDMHGNSFEWCRDWYHATLPGGTDPDLYLAKASATRSEHGGVSRARRGGCWADDGWPCRSAFRLRFEPERRYDHIGFRVVAVQP